MPLENKIIVLDFWATWCGPCIKSLIETNSMVEKYRDRAYFVCISDEPEKSVLSLLKKRIFEHYFVLDSAGATFENFNIDGIPTTLVIDRKGAVVWAGHPSSLEEEFLVRLTNGKDIGKQITDPNHNVVTVKDPFDDWKNYTFKFEIRLPDSTKNGTTTRFKNNDAMVHSDNVSVLRLVSIMLNMSERELKVSDKALTAVNQRIGISYKNQHASVDDAKSWLLKQLQSVCKIKMASTFTEKPAYVLRVKNQTLLENHRTMLNPKDTTMQDVGSGSGVINTATGKVFVGIGITLTQLAESLSRNEGKHYVTHKKSVGNMHQYDFEIPINSFREIEEGLKRYGIILSNGKYKHESIEIVADSE